MRLRESVSAPLHPGGLNNNNQLRRLHGAPSRGTGSPEIADRNENGPRNGTEVASPLRRPAASDVSEGFRLAEDTTTWSSLAVARDNSVQQQYQGPRQPDSTLVNVNNNLTEPGIRRASSVESLTDYEGMTGERSANANGNLNETVIRRNCSPESLDEHEGRSSPQENSSRELTPSDWSDCSEEGNLPTGCRGIVNPNYPGFQHLAPSLLSDTDLTEDEHDSCSDYPPVYHRDAPPPLSPLENSNEYNNNIDDSVNHLWEQRNNRKVFYEKPKFNIQTVTSLYEAVVPPSEKCINYVKSVEISRSEEEALSPGPEEVAVNGIVEAETHLTLLDEPEEGLADRVNERAPDLSQAILQQEREREVPVEVELVELSTSVKQSLQFPEIEEILDSGKTSEIGETDDIAVEHIDLIREAKELPHPDRSKIGNRQPVTKSTAGSADDDDESESNSDYSEGSAKERPTYTKLEEIDLLSSIGRDIGVDLEKYAQPVPDVVAMEPIESIRANQSRPVPVIKDHVEDTNKLLDRQLPEVSSADARKKEKMARNQAKRRQQQQQQQQQQHQFRNSNSQRRSDKRRADIDNGSGGFDVYNIETAMPKIDLDAIESHLKAAREEERREDDKEAAGERNKPPMPEPIVIIGRSREMKDGEREDLITRFDRVVRGEPDRDPQRRNDREEIRRRLAMGPDAEDLRAERGRKPSLQSRLQSGMNLQICFMNETSSDTESPGSENDLSPGSTPASFGTKQPGKQQAPVRPQILSLPSLRLDSGMSSTPPVDEADFFARQARLQTEARMALAQAKDMAHMQMEVERQRLKQSPITEMVRCSLEKVGVQLGEDRRRLSRALLTELNVAQLQVVANDLHARIATLNEALVEGLLRRDDLHMEQDSMLVDVEDLTRYLGAKQESLKKKQQSAQQAANRNHQQSSSPAPMKLSMKPKLTHFNRGLVALVRK